MDPMSEALAGPAARSGAGVVEEFLLHLAEERIISNAQLQLAKQALGVWRPVMEQQQQLEGQAQGEQKPSGLDVGEHGVHGSTHHHSDNKDEEEPCDQSPLETPSQRSCLNPSQLNHMVSLERPQEAEAEGRLGLLPESVLDQLMPRLAAEPGGSSVRRTCRWLRSAFDRCNTRLAIKGPVLPGFYLKAHKLLCGSPSISRLTLEDDVELYTMAAGGELLPRLERLCLKGLRRHTDIIVLSQCTSLLHLELRHCVDLDMDLLASCVTLLHLDVRGCLQVQDIESLSACVELQHLDLRRCIQVEDLQPLSACVELQHLDLGGCNQVQDLSPLAPCVKMQYLDLEHCQHIEDLGPLSAMLELQHLSLACSSIKDLDPLSECVSLQYVDLGGCVGVTDLGALASLVQLSCLWLNACPVADLSPLSTCIRLEHLGLFGCGLEDLGPLAACVSLSCLVLCYCDNVQQLDPLAECVRLRYLNLQECPLVQNLAPLAALADLQCLNLRGCRTSLDLGPLAALSGLVILKQ